MRSSLAYLAIDETLYPYCGSIGIKQYNPSKPATYGFLYRSLCDAVVSYTYYTLPYAGKPSERNNEASKYYISGTYEYTIYQVPCKWCKSLQFHRRIQHIYGSVFHIGNYSSMGRALEKKMTIVGTMRLDCKGTPKEIKSLENREERSVLYVFDGDEKICLVFDIDKKKPGKRNVAVLCTVHDEVRVTKDERRKPDIHNLYDHAKDGVGVVDLVSASCTKRIKSRGWPINVFAFILDTVRTNAKTILQESTAKTKISNFEFLYALGKLLVLPQIERCANPNGIQIDQMQRMRAYVCLWHSGSKSLCCNQYPCQNWAMLCLC